MSVSPPSLGAKLDSARMKVRRANEHIRALKQALKRFLKRDPYAFRVEHYADVITDRMIRVVGQGAPRSPSGLVLPYRQNVTRDFFTSIPIRVIVTPRPDVPFPALRWGVIVGKIVHNLASALDNLVSELVEVNPSPPPPPPGANRKERSRFKKIRDWQKFPICATRPEWGAALDRDIMYVDPISQATLEEAQPFYGWENFGVIPKSHPLFILHKLWNRDKHSTVNLAGAGLGFHFPNLELPGLFPGHGYLSSETIKSLPSRPIVGDTEVAIIRVLFPHPIEFRSNIEVSVKPNMSLTILFGEGAPGEGENVFDVLGRARDTIVNLLNRFA